MSIAICGASGTTGSKVAKYLLSAGHKVRLLGRAEERLSDLMQMGGQFVSCSLDHEEQLLNAFDGTDAVYVVIPNAMQAADIRQFQAGIAQKITLALKKTGVSRAVSLSAVGAHLEQDSGIIQGLHDMEQLLNDVAELNVKHLRATYFMENLNGQAASIKFTGKMGSTMNPDLVFSAITTNDIAKVAAQELSTCDFEGKSHLDLLGQRDITYREICPILGAAVGKADIAYERKSYSTAYQQMTELWGFSDDVANSMIEFDKRLHEGKIYELTSRKPENTTEESIEDYAIQFGKIYETLQA